MKPRPEWPRPSSSQTRIIGLDLKAYFDNVQHYLLLEESGATDQR